MLEIIKMAGPAKFAEKKESLLSPIGETKRMDLIVVTLALKRPRVKTLHRKKLANHT